MNPMARKRRLAAPQGLPRAEPKGGLQIITRIGTQ
jgi:hypothetical protein